MSKKVTKIGVLTSGGDSPGMNACVRAVVRTGVHYGLEMYGIHRGFSGMFNNEIKKLGIRDVGNIIQRGGTILKTSRCKEFFEPEGRATAYQNLIKHGIDGLVIIGGDGSFKGAQKLSNEFDIPCIGLPGTIDKDIAGTDFTIGFDTAVNTAVEAIDKIRDTADAHDRLFVIEVMGRDAGYIALHSGIATGAEHILIPERKTDMDDIIKQLHANADRKKLFNLIIVAEGDEFGGATQVAEIIKEKVPKLEVRVCILGHIQRGGNPSCLDRLIASRMGYAAVEALIDETAQYHNHFIGIVNNRIHYTPLNEAIKKKQRISDEWMKIAKILAQ